jgi:uncharacterized protein YdaU (DUF1376 family)
MSKAPAFQLYAADFYMDTAGWTATEVGAYFRLLMHQWVNGSVPSDNASRARIAGIDHRNMAKMWSVVMAKKFTVDVAGMYVNPRLEAERQKQANYKEKQALKGNLGNEIRWKDHIAVATQKRSPKHRSSSSSSTPNTYKDKTLYGECVFLTSSEYEKLTHQHGQNLTDKAIAILNDYMMSSGKKYKSHYHTLIRWPLQRAQEVNSGTGTNNPIGRYERPGLRGQELSGEAARAMDEVKRLERERAVKHAAANQA